MENGALSIDHLERAEPAEMGLLARCSTVATLLPCESFCAGTQPPPGRALVDGGAAVALATNFNPRNSPILSMQAAVSLACLQMGLTAGEAISAATINGAHALGWADRAGSLERGKPADLLLLNISDYRDLPQQLGTNLVHLTMKRGDPIYQEGKVVRQAAWPGTRVSTGAEGSPALRATARQLLPKRDGRRRRRRRNSRAERIRSTRLAAAPGIW